MTLLWILFQGGICITLPITMLFIFVSLATSFIFAKYYVISELLDSLTLQKSSLSFESWTSIYSWTK